MQRERVHNIKCPKCGKFQSIKVYPPVPKFSFWRCDLCGGSIPLEYNEQTHNFRLPRSEFRESEIGELDAEGVMLFAEN